MLGYCWLFQSPSSRGGKRGARSHNSSGTPRTPGRKRGSNSSSRATGRDPFRHAAKRTDPPLSPNRLRDDDDELTDRCCSPPTAVDSPSYGRTTPQYRRHRRSNAGAAPISPHYSNDARPFPYVSPERKPTFSQSNQSPTAKRNNSSTAGTLPKKRISASSNFSSCSSQSTSDIDSDNGVIHRRKLLSPKGGEGERKLRSPGRDSAAKESKSPGGSSSTMLRRPPFAPPLSGSANSGSVAGGSGAGGSLYTNRGGSPMFANSQDATAGASAAVLAAAATLAGSNHPLADALGQAASNLLGSGAVGMNPAANNVPGMSALPRSHLPPNKRAMAAVTAAAALMGSSTGSSLDTTTGCLSANQNIFPTDATVPSPRKMAHKGVQVSFFIYWSHGESNSPDT